MARRQVGRLSSEDQRPDEQRAGRENAQLQHELDPDPGLPQALLPEQHEREAAQQREDAEWDAAAEHHDGGEPEGRTRHVRRPGAQRHPVHEREAP